MAPTRETYDVVIVGGAIFGSSLAWWLTQTPGFDGRVLVVERDPTYEFASTSHTNSCIRQQFTATINVKVSQFGATFVKNFRDFMGGDPDVPHLTLQNFGYMYLADTPEFAETLKRDQQVQMAMGAGTRHMMPDEIAANYPFYALDDILAGNHNLVDEGYFDGGTMFDWFKRMARRNGVEYIHDEVVAMTKSSGGTIDSVTLKSGAKVACGKVVNASGPRAMATAKMAGVTLPVEPRKRYTYVFDAANPLDRDLPLTIDPSGVHFRTDGKYYMAGSAPEGEDAAVAYDDFTSDHSLWENKVWPAIATRIPQFERIKVINEWVGHYAYNTLDQNAILGAHDTVTNFYFMNGFSGHGLQQSPALGRGIAELIAYGAYRSLDLIPFDFKRIETGTTFLEKAII